MGDAIEVMCTGKDRVASAPHCTELHEAVTGLRVLPTVNQLDDLRPFVGRREVPDECVLILVIYPDSLTARRSDDHLRRTTSLSGVRVNNLLTKVDDY